MDEAMGDDAVQASFVDRVAARVKPTASLGMIENAQAIVRAMTITMTLGALQAVAGAAFFVVFDEPTVAWVLFPTAGLFVVAWVWFVSTGRVLGALLIALLAAPAPVIVHVALGGYAYSGGSLFMSIILVSNLPLLFGGRAAVLGVAGFGAVAVIMGVFEDALRASREPPDPTLTTLMFVIVLVSNLTAVPPSLAYLLEKLRSERARSEGLLRNMLPEAIATRLKSGEQIIADHHEECTVLFADIVGFTAYSRHVPPAIVVDELNTIFSRFDELAVAHAVLKIKTIGDGYMAVAGVPDPRPDHLEAICAMAIDMQDTIRSHEDRSGVPFQVRIGIHTGPVVAGVIGTERLSFDLWGDTVNLASRMESFGEPGRIQVSGAVRDRAPAGFEFGPLRAVPAKGYGSVDACFLEVPATR
jgi:adenylate cyclase